ISCSSKGLLPPSKQDILTLPRQTFTPPLTAGPRGGKTATVIRPCLVQIPAPSGGHHPYEVEADSSLSAAALAVRLYSKPSADEAVITVIPGGASPLLWNAHRLMQAGSGTVIAQPA